MSDTLPDWVRVDKKRFTTIKNNVKRVPDKNKFVTPGRSGSRIYVNDSYYLIQDIEHGEITYEEALEIMLKIHNDIKKIVSQNALNPSQIEVLINKFVKGNDERILEIFKEGSDEQLHTTDKFDLERKKSAAQKKINHWED